jgi:hypothetical protein
VIKLTNPSGKPVQTTRQADNGGRKADNGGRKTANHWITEAERQTMEAERRPTTTAPRCICNSPTWWTGYDLTSKQVSKRAETYEGRRLELGLTTLEEKRTGETCNRQILNGNEGDHK